MEAHVEVAARGSHLPPPQVEVFEHVLAFLLKSMVKRHRCIWHHVALGPGTLVAFHVVQNEVAHIPRHVVSNILVVHFV